MTSDYFPIRLPSLISHIHTDKPVDWLTYFIAKIGSVNDLINRSSSELLDMVYMDSLPNNPAGYFGAMSASILPSQSIFMVASTTGRIHFIHHIQIRRSPDGTIMFLGLSGFGSQASPIIIPGKAFILPTPVAALTPTHILRHMSFSMDGVSDDDLESISLRPLVPLPPFFSSFLLGTNTCNLNTDASPINVLRALDSAIKSLDAAVNKDSSTTLNWEADSSFVATFLFLVDSSVSHQFGVDLSQPKTSELSSTLESWALELHSVLRETVVTTDVRKTAADQSTTAATPATAATTTTTTSPLPQPAKHSPPTMPYDVQQLFAQSLALQKTLTEALTKKHNVDDHITKRWNKLPDSTKRMALAAASIDGEHPADDLPASGLEFISANVSSAKSVLETFVRSLFPKFMVSYQQLLVLRLHLLMLTWSRSDLPDGVSVFFTPSCRPEIGESRAALTANLEESNQSGFSTATVQSLTRACKISVPTSYSNLLRQVQNFYALFVVVFGRQSRIAETLRLVVDEIESNEDALSIMISSDQDFVLKFLFNIDNVVQRFFKHILSHSIDCQALGILSELTDMFGAINSFTYHGPQIPSSLYDLVRHDHRSPSRPTQSGSGAASSTPKKRKIKNEYRDARWALRTSESFAKFFVQRNSVPTILQTPICLKYHILGHCTSTCPRASTHIPLTGAIASQLSSFVNKCRSATSNSVTATSSTEPSTNPTSATPPS